MCDCRPDVARSIFFSRFERLLIVVAVLLVAVVVK
jgi:hypothetical protein